MSPQDFIDSLASVPFFDGMDHHYLEQFTDCARIQHYEPGHYILVEGQPADCFHIILGGTVLIETSGGNRGAIPIQSLGAGDVLGWSWMIPPYVWHFDALVTEHCRSVVVDALRIRDKCHKDLRLECELYKRFSQLMCRRLTATRLQLLDVYK